MASPKKPKGASGSSRKSATKAGTRGEKDARGEPDKAGKTSGRKRAAAARKSAKTPPSAAPDGAVDFPIVGIGASAGGLEAFKGLLSAMPEDTGMAFVLVQHLDPRHESMMVELLSRCTGMRVVQIADGMRVQPDHVYMIPPNTSLAMQSGKLVLDKPVERRGMRMPIDFFLRSLAEDQKEKAIGIILSGTGTDGTLGLKAIKEFGGLAIVQDPHESGYDGMPVSAIGTGMIDYTLPVADIPKRLVRFVSHFYMHGGRREEEEETPSALNQIIALLLARMSCNFHYYKKSTLVRRIERRMGLNGVESIDDYLPMLREDPEELLKLYKDLLITVTAFFRDSELMEEMARTALASLVRNLPPEQPLRVWVTGCATGEEAYTIGILLFEQFELAGRQPNIQIFATDIDESALDVGRAAIYPESIAADVTPGRLKRFFTKEGQSYQINKQLRDCVVFAHQNLVSDPPFSKLDLISCRNLLIYIEADVQKKIIQLFHFALREGGVLFLGSSETIGRNHAFFEVLSKPAKVYRRIGTSRRNAAELPMFSVDEVHATVRHGAGASARPRREIVPAEIAQRALLERYAHPSVLIDRGFHIHYFYGKTGQFLDNPTGEPTNDLLLMAQPAIRTKIRSAVFSVTRGERQVTEERAKLKDDGRYIPVKISAVRVDNREDGLILVIFEKESEPQPEPEMQPAVVRHEGEVSEQLFAQMEQELMATREDLQSSIEELETSNEELKASNEEAMSMNEELQSTNEELETSKEELQSLNEELNTVNSQLQEKVEELERTNNDFANLLNSTDIATVFLDTEFNIKRFTPASRRLLHLIATDVGRPFSDIARNVADDGLLKDAERVLETLTPIEREVSTSEGDWYLRRVLPYRTHDNKIDGVVITFANITELMKTERSLRESERRLSDAHRIAQLGNWDWDIPNNHLWWSDEIFRIFGIDKHSAKWTYERFLDRVHPEDRASVEASVQKALIGGTPYDIDHRIVMPDQSIKFVHEQGEVSFDGDGKPQRMQGVMLDITSRAEAEQALVEARDNLEEKIRQRTRALEEATQVAESASRSKSEFLSAMSHELRTPLNAILGFGQLLESDPDHPLESMQRVCVENILEGGNHLLELVSDILDLAGIEAGKLDLAVEAVECRDIIDPCVRMTAALGKKFGVTVESRGDLASAPVVLADPTRARQVLLNLITNAVKYNRRGGSVKIGGAQTQHNTFRFVVEDTGFGIPEDQFQRLFVPFARLGGAPAHASDGTRGVGIGLFISKQLTERMGGTIGVESTVGKGSVFWFELPIHEGAVDAEKDKSHLLEDVDIEKIAAGIEEKKTVLYIEDNPSNTSLMIQIFKRVPTLNLVTAGTAEEGLALIGKNKPDLVLMDVNLPGMSGVEACRVLKEQRETEAVPVIAVTGNAMIHDVEGAQGAGFSAYITKPFRAGVLLELIRDTLV